MPKHHDDGIDLFGDDLPDDDRPASATPDDRLASATPDERPGSATSDDERPAREAASATATTSATAEDTPAAPAAVATKAPAAVATKAPTDGKRELPPDTAWRKGLRGIGQTLISLGVVVLLFIVYEAFITDIFTAQKQDQLSQQLKDKWDDNPTVGEPTQETNFADVPVGDAFAVMRVPAFGADYAQVVVEGTTNEALEKGPGHYSGTAGPGEVGNFSIAGHRVGKGSPFLNLDKLKPGDAIVFETAANWYVYRVIGNKQTGDFSDPAYGDIKGQFITKPSNSGVIAPVPNQEGATPTQRLLTLTTCHPKFSAAERMIIHAYLDGEPLPKSQFPTAANVPALKEG